MVYMIQLTFEEDVGFSGDPLRFILVVENDVPLSEIRSMAEPDIGNFVFLCPQPDSQSRRPWNPLLRGSEKSLMVSEVATSMTGDTKKTIVVMIRKQGLFVTICLIEPLF